MIKISNDTVTIKDMIIVYKNSADNIIDFNNSSENIKCEITNNQFFNFYNLSFIKRMKLKFKLIRQISKL
ncbi:hypothetical protein QTH47_12615 [Clostridium perfringens]|uniref:hypothetical protein n=1 Tax=Clostridium perfringens TaxID=1502 RepID=UPI0007075D4C|nr:hypothetical protein [Clostridium perfringens]KQC91362.1 hypothetical protein AM596_15120 [Clostridium perfringens CP4]MDM0659959.1 hypothetical protein [Clostridium perfringens]